MSTTNGNLPNGGSNSADGWRTGSIPNPATTYRGAFNSPIELYSIVPQALAVNAVAANQAPSNSAYLVLRALAPYSTQVSSFWPGVGIVNMYQLDVPRAVSVTVTVATTSATNVTVWGLDHLGAPLSETIVVGTNVNPQTVNGKKAFSKIYRAFSTIYPGNPMSLGTTDVFGLPYVTTSATQIITEWDLPAGLKFGTATLGGGTGTATISTAAVNSDSVIKYWRQAPGAGALGNLSIPTITPATSFVIDSDANTDVSVVAWELAFPQPLLVTAALTDPATGTTGDVRGTLAPYTVANGGRRLTAWQYVPGAVGQVQSRAGMFGVTQFAAAFS